MARRLTEEEKAQIIADAALLCNYREVARKHGVSDITVRRLCHDMEMSQIVAEKREKCIVSMQEFLATKTGEATDLISQIMAEISKPERIEKTSTKDLATIFGILVDKFAGLGQRDINDVIPITVTFKDHSIKGERNDKQNN